MMNTQTQTTKNVTLNIGSMACSGCADTVQNALNDLEGVESASVDLDNESALVLYDASTVSTGDFQKAIDEAGYDFKGLA